MTWPQFAAARQLLAEKRVGTVQRAAVLREEAAVGATQDAIRRQPVLPRPVNADGTQGMARMPGTGTRGVA